MFFFQFARKNRRIRSLLGLSLPLLWLSGVALIGTGAAQAEPQQQQPPANTQQQNPQPQPSQPPPGANTQQKPSEAPPPEAGGPGNDVGPYVIPKKKEEPPPPPAEKPKKVEGMPDYSINVEVPLVNLDVLVTTKNGQFVPGLKKDNFRVLEDGVAQPISNFSQAEAPITAVLLVEFASTNYQFLYDALNASYTFAGGLKKEDWVEWAEAHGYLGSLGSLNYLQAENQLNTFSRMTGGRAYFPRFQGELPEIFRDIASDIRNEYNIAYHPTNAKLDGSYRKLKVELVAPDGGPLKIKDQKGHDLKYQIIARDGYTAKHTVE